MRDWVILRSLILSLKGLYSNFEICYNNFIYFFEDILDVDFVLIRNYFQISGENKIFTTNIISRDSVDFMNINGIVKLWIKIFNTKNTNIFGYQKVNFQYLHFLYLEF